MFGRLASGKPGGKGKEKEEYAVHELFSSGFARIDQFPEFRIFSKNLVLRQGKLGAKSKVLKRVFVKDAVDGESFRGFLEVDTVLPSTIAVESSVRATDNAETVRVFF
jgi:hypothetical protein